MYQRFIAPARIICLLASQFKSVPNYRFLKKMFMVSLVIMACGTELLFARSGPAHLNFTLPGAFSNLDLQVDGVIRGKVVNENGDPAEQKCIYKQISQ